MDTAITESKVLTPYGGMDLSFLILAQSRWAIVCCALMCAAAFGLGWWCGRRRSDMLVTLRPASDAPTAPNRLKPCGLVLWTARYGDLWRSDVKC